jgi:hypothetical protein
MDNDMLTLLDIGAHPGDELGIFAQNGLFHRILAPFYLFYQNILTDKDASVNHCCIIFRADV